MQITGAATGPDEEIIQEGEEGERVMAAHPNPGRFMDTSEIGADELDYGNGQWANFQQYWEIFKEDRSILCSTVREAGDGRTYSSRPSAGVHDLCGPILPSDFVVGIVSEELERSTILHSYLHLLMQCSFVCRF